MWDVGTGQQKLTLEGHTDSVESVAFSPDGGTLASGGRDKTIRLWDVSTGQQKLILEEHADFVQTVAFSPDGNTVASGSWDSTVRLWDVSTGQQKQILEGHTDYVQTVAFSPNGSTLASGGYDGTIRLWDTVTGQQKQILEGHSAFVESVAFSPDGNTLASGSYDGTILLWELILITNAVVRILPTPMESPAIGEQLVINVGISGGENVAGYQCTVWFDAIALRYVSRTNGDYLRAGVFEIPPIVKENSVTLAATSLAGESNGDGTLATLTFEVISVKASTLNLSEVLLSNNAGEMSRPDVESGQVVEPPQIVGDVNRDQVVNIEDLVLVAAHFGESGQNDADINGDAVVNIADLVLVARAFGNAASAPATHPHVFETLTAAEVQKWLTDARQLEVKDAKMARGILVLEQLLATLAMPTETALLRNYPNPFNPETWIPYQLAAPAEVTLTVYTENGQVVRRLAVGHQPAGLYQSRNRAAYWDGRNQLGEPVASGVYFYTLTAGDFTATLKMLVSK